MGVHVERESESSRGGWHSSHNIVQWPLPTPRLNLESREWGKIADSITPWAVSDKFLAKITSLFEARSPPGLFRNVSKIRCGNLNHVDVWWRHNRCQQISCKWTTGAVVEAATEPLRIIVRQSLNKLNVFMITDHHNHCFNDEKSTK